MSWIVLNTSDSDTIFLDPESIHMVARWGRKWLAGVDDRGISCLVSLDHIASVEEKPEEEDE